MSIKAQFCPNCGKSTKNLQESLCVECYTKAHSPSLPKSLSVRYCTVCKSIFDKGIWVTATKPPEKYLEQKIKQKIVLPALETLKDVKILGLGKDGSIRITFKINEDIFTCDKRAKIDIEKFACPECSRQFKTDVTAIIQARTRDNTQKFVKEILDLARSVRNKIVKAKEHLHGIDLSFSDKRTARVLSRKIKDHFKCNIKESVKQRGWDRSKERPLVQTTYLLRQK